MSCLKYIVHLVALTVLLLVMAPAMAQDFVYVGETSTLEVDSVPDENYSWALYSDSTVNFAIDQGDPEPMDYADFVGGSGRKLVNVLWKKPGTYYFKVTALDAAGCAKNMKIGRIKVKEALPTAVITDNLEAVCAGEEVALEVTFTGVAPWSFTYAANDTIGTTYTTITGVMTSPYLLMPDPRPLRTTGYRITTITDKYGTNYAGSNSVIQTVNPLPVTSGIYLVNGSPTNGEAAICLNETEAYGVKDTPSSSYSWKINNDTIAKDWIITATGHNTIAVSWKKAGTYTLTVQEKSDAGCWGAVQSMKVIVNPLPVVDSLKTTACSGSTIDITLPATDKNTIALTKYDITAVVDPALTGTATSGTNITDINTITDDKFTNTTGIDLKVVYTITPYAGSCEGAKFTITVTIHSAPVVAPVLATACSDLTIDVTLPEKDKNTLVLTRYDITAVVDPDLKGNATTGNGIIDINALKDDQFSNTTGGDLTVIYQVIPYVGSCAGAPFPVTITIKPTIDTSKIYYK